ncbi:MAG: metal-dependent hydrolase [Pseudomonadota bacterium]
MDNLTHGLTGALMGQTGLKKKTGLGIAALVLGANLPDIDVVGLLWLDSQEALGFRRGITHGPIGVALLPIGLAALLWGFDRWQSSRGKRPETRDPVSFKWLYILALIGAISHSLMDWLNNYGVRFLYPFDKSWYYGDTLFIIDIVLWVILAASIWWSVRVDRRGGNGAAKAWIGITVSLAYIAMNYGITYLAETNKGTFAEPYPSFVIGNPQPGQFWRRERIIQTQDDRWYSTDWEGEALGYGYFAPELTLCQMPENAAAQSTQAAGFMTWSRAPIATRAEDGSVILYDARFFAPLVRERFFVELPNVQCEELSGD